MEQQNFCEIEKLQAQRFPEGSVETDNDGQIVIYTGRYENSTERTPVCRTEQTPICRCVYRDNPIYRCKAHQLRG